MKGVQWIIEGNRKKKKKKRKKNRERERDRERNTKGDFPRVSTVREEKLMHAS